MIQTCKHPIYLKDKDIYVPCNKCDACISTYRQNWLDRLDLEAKSSAAVLFFTLTYDNEHAPILTFDPFANAFYSNRSSDDDIYLDDYKGLEDYYLKNLPSISDSRNVLENKNLKQFTYACKTDLQKFLKRLRRKIDYDKNNLISANEDKTVRYFAVSEYGPRTHRAHFHGLLYFSSKCVANAVTKSYFAQSWNLCSNDNLRCENVSTSASSYVSKYLHCTTSLPAILSIKQKTRPFYLASRRPAIGCNYFNFNELLSKVEQRSLNYVKTFNTKDGLSTSTKQLPGIVSRFFFEKPYKSSIYDVHDYFNFFNSPFCYLRTSDFETIKKLDVTKAYNYLSKILPSYINSVEKKLNDSCSLVALNPVSTLSDLYPKLSRDEKNFGVAQNRRVLIRATVSIIHSQISVMDYVERFLNFYSIKSSTSLQFMYAEYDKLINDGVRSVDALRFIYPSFFRALPKNVYEFTLSPRYDFYISVLASFYLTPLDLYPKDVVFEKLNDSFDAQKIFQDYCQTNDYIAYENELSDKSMLFEKVRLSNHINNYKNNSNEIF